MNHMDRAVIITGGAGAIGSHTASRFLAAGAKVAIADLDADAVRTVVARLRAEHPDRTIVGLTCDVRDRKQCLAMADEALTKLGAIHVGVNLAGVIGPGPSIDVSQDEWERVVDINLNGTFYCCQAFAQAMQNGGAIVNTSSIAASTAWPARASYAAAKAAVTSLTKTLATEWAERRIRVNAVAPGWVDTELIRPAVEQGYIDLRRIERAIPLHRIATKDDVASAILFLAAEEASYITGQTLLVDGGFIAGSPASAIT
jgi:NAD(P)-dependent dehydrogenase (short-subunit alcohol dehydrogenase family)